MSNRSSSLPEGDPKFTTGEKCLFIHLIITFSFILFLVIVMIFHLYLVDHYGGDVWNIKRRQMKPEKKQVITPVGVLYLNENPKRVVCNTVLLRKQWSLAPGHCVAVRTHPDVADLLYKWKIKYSAGTSKITDTGVKRSIPHPRFNSDTYDNNVGLLQHENYITFYEHIFSNIFIINDDDLQQNSENMDMISWAHKRRSVGEEQLILPVKPVKYNLCSQLMAPIIELRKHEFCVEHRGLSQYADHGAVFVINSKIIGFFSWGEKNNTIMPMIMLNIAHFKDWLEFVITSL